MADDYLITIGHWTVVKAPQTFAYTLVGKTMIVSLGMTTIAIKGT